jgi:hypothetical protein
MSISRNAPSLAAAVLVAAALVSLSPPPAGAVPRLPARASTQDPAQPSPQPRLRALLAKAAEYCRKLESSAFDLVCREEIAETVNPSLDAGTKSPASRSGGTTYAGPTISIGWTNKVKRTLVNDLRCGRAGGAIQETRTLLEENGKKKAGTDAPLDPPVVTYGTALFGPVGLFGERFQPNYDFRVAGEAEIGGTNVLVVEAKPRPGVGLTSPGPLETGAPAGGDLYGKAWVDPATGDILRLEWSERLVGRFEVFEKRGELYKRKPRLVIRSEFGAEKNGVRFPSRLSVEEAYLKGSGKAFIRSRTEVVYKDFKFLSVSFDVRDRSARAE